MTIMAASSAIIATPNTIPTPKAAFASVPNCVDADFEVGRAAARLVVNLHQ
jgi:hypothetical protein